MQRSGRPRITKDIENLIRECTECKINARENREPLQMVPVPSAPWETVGTDLFQFHNMKYLIVVDYYSRYIEKITLKDERSITIINVLKSIFARHGIPQNVISDNGRQYTSSEFKEFSIKYKFKYITSSPKHPRGNGVAERAVQTTKQILEKSDDPYLGLLSYRSTPLSFGISPAELLMNRKICTTLPDLNRNIMMNQEDHDRFVEDVKTKKKKEKQYHDNKYTLNKRNLEEDEEVYIRDMGRTGVIRSRETGNIYDRSYTIETDKQTIRRNRKDIIPVNKDNNVVTRSGRISKPPIRLIEQ